MDFDWKKIAYSDATNSFAYWNLYIEIICNVFLIYAYLTFLEVLLHKKVLDHATFEIDILLEGSLEPDSQQL